MISLSTFISSISLSPKFDLFALGYLFCGHLESTDGAGYIRLTGETCHLTKFINDAREEDLDGFLKVLVWRQYGNLGRNNYSDPINKVMKTRLTFF
jgi:hypothetical protein